MKLNSKSRDKLKSSQFAEPGKRAYLINDRAHAINEKARAVQQFEKGNISKSVEEHILGAANRKLR